MMSLTRQEWNEYLDLTSQNQTAAAVLVLSDCLLYATADETLRPTLRDAIKEAISPATFKDAIKTK